ncbi:MotB family protein [Propylenella binzhouense]|uniref:MotB family protein n=1 Tax=Propylenella binzhouense TaxID=2555902 RepID=A0A964WSH3_9HYPH|nr:MotB family protein [Propylenella binzhouense]MYZ46969.1 MotB family protein [Propylenella binzhouense]
MADSSAAGEHELVIIRRRHDDHGDGHHGGVWKIAYADFMTAMMAFFLVMWLINATDEKTKTSVASYFNPLKLADTTTNPKGIRDPKRVDGGGRLEGGSDTKPEAKQGDGGDIAGHGTEMPPPVPKEAPAPEHAAAAEQPARYSEEALFANPYAVLDEIAANAKTNGGIPDRQEVRAAGGGDQAGLKGGEAFRDPFDPASWPSPDGITFEPGAADPVVPAPVPPPPPPAAGVPGPAPAPLPAKTAEVASREPSGDPARPTEAVSAGPEGKAESAAESEAEAVRAELEGAIDPQRKGDVLPHVDVSASAEGTLINLSDDRAFGMFAIGSAEPRPEVIAIMEKIAAILESRTGRIVIRGHTDGRPFRSAEYDNWRLSTARAHMAQYMLVRGGLDEGRIERLEGYADRDLRNPADPEAAENRRIEILLRREAR